MEPLQSAVVSFLNLLNLPLGSKADVKYRMLLMCPGAGQDLIGTRLWMHIPYLSNKIYRGPEIYSACKILLNVGMSCAMTIVWECIVSAGRKMVTSVPNLMRMPGVLGWRRRCTEGMQGARCCCQEWWQGGWGLHHHLTLVLLKRDTRARGGTQGDRPSKGGCWGKQLFDHGGSEGLAMNPALWRVSSILQHSARSGRAMDADIHRRTRADCHWK